MSAYIVGHETIQKIINSLTTRDLWPPQYQPCPVEKDKLGQALLDLNALSVEERYGKGEAKEFGVPLVFVPVKGLPFQKDIEFLKTLDCYLYQSCEGRAVETPLFSYLEHVKHLLEARIVRDLPQYEDAEWG
jgi:hypothetical protein